MDEENSKELLEYTRDPKNPEFLKGHPLSTYISGIILFIVDITRINYGTVLVYVKEED